MLERVSPSAECAAHIFLRRFEAPVRSHRNLDRTFWRYGYERSEAPAWWPSYLDSIRSKSLATPYTTPIFESSTCSNAPVIARCRTSRTSKCDSRAFSNVTTRNQTAPAQAIAEDSNEAEDEQHFSQKGGTRQSFRATKKVRQEPSVDDLHFRPKSLRHRSASSNQAWKAFITSGWKQEQAAPLLDSLAGGNAKLEFERALKTFESISRPQRTAEDYDNAIQAAIRIDRYSAAIKWIKEAVSRQLSEEVYFKFLALCISKELWNTAADLWTQVGRVEGRTLQLASHDPNSNKRNFAGKYAACFDIVTDLPSKLVHLANRLQNDDSVIATRKDCLVGLCEKLLILAAESEKVMGSITSQGLLSLFTIQQQFRFNTKLHLAAIATVGAMKEKETRGQLALLVYRNLRFAYPDAFIPKWVFGTMISICSASRQSPQIYRSLLDDYKTAYGIAENGIYLQVMTACANQGEVKDLEAIFDDFCKTNRPKTADDLYPLIRVHAIVGNAKEAQIRFNQIKRRFGLQPNAKSWNTLLLAYSRSTQPSAIFDKFKEMENSKVRPDAHSWSILVAAAAKRGDTQYARDLVNQARKVGISPPLAMVGAIVDSYLASNQPGEAWSLVLTATQQARLTSESPVRLWNSLLRYFAFKSDSDAILRVQEKMKDLDVKADGMTYAALMTALVVQGRTQDAAEILRTLQFGQVLNANEFHYSILVHGFAMEKKHDAAAVIYREMLERFHRATPSAKLSMLYLRANRDEEKARTKQLAGASPTKPDFRPSLDMVNDILTNIQPSDLASPLPNPGLKRLSGHNDMENIYFESLITFLQRNNAHLSAQQIFEAAKEQQRLANPILSEEKSSWTGLVSTLSRELEMATATRDWSKVSSIWDRILEITLQNAVPVKSMRKLSSKHLNDRHKPRNDESLGSVSSEFTSMIPHKLTVEGSNVPNLSILPAHRYILSRPLSQYIKALDKQQNHSEMIDTVQKLNDYQFSLSSKNWNGFIQSLCRSSSSDHHILAYEIFERYLLPNAPSWEIIRRGKWVQPSEERPRNKWDKILKKKDDRKSRKDLEKLDPGLLMPSYYTLVHLAIVWLKASRTSSQGNHTLKQRLEERTAGTVKLVLKIPYLRDRVQGILLRGRSVVGDLMKRPRQYDEPTTFAGIQGSTLLIDQIPPEIMAEIKSMWADREAPITIADLPIAEQLFGEIEQSPIVLPSKGRLETGSERQKRIRIGQQHKLALLSRVLEELRQTSSEPTKLVGSSSRGQDPYLPMDTVQTAEISPRYEAATISKIQSILETLSKKPMHKASALAISNNETLIRTNSLTRRLGLRMYRPASLGGLIATPRREKRFRLRFRRPTKFLASLKATGDTLDQQMEILKQARKTAAAREKQRAHFLKLSKFRYHSDTVKASAKTASSRKAVQRLAWHKQQLRRSSARLYASQLRRRRLAATMVLSMYRR